MFVITLLAVLVISVFVAGMLPLFSTAKLFDITVNESAAEAYLPEGHVGEWVAITDRRSRTSSRSPWLRW